MKLIKASERLPEPFKNLPIRNIKSGKFYISQLRGGFFYSTENEIDEIKNIEWMDESQPQKEEVNEGRDKNGQTFEEWADDNGCS